jgi:endonuclease/exonuclease/phosphatase family metal-dependent hydrolase
MMESLRLITWNMGYAMEEGYRRRHEDAWKYLLEELDPHIALLQETKPPAVYRDHLGLHWARAYDSQEWGTGLFVQGLGTESEELDEADGWIRGLPAEPMDRVKKLPGWVASLRVALPDGTWAVVVSIHSPNKPIERRRLEGVDTSTMVLSVQDDLWLLDVLFFFLRRRIEGTQFLIGGDFNYSRLFDVPVNRGNTEFFERTEGEGFMSLHRKFRNHDDQTYFKPGLRPHQLDYLLADPITLNRCTSCRVIDYAEVHEFSDHAPMLAQLNY